jgi:hypothetical protein
MFHVDILQTRPDSLNLTPGAFVHNGHRANSWQVLLNMKHEQPGAGGGSKALGVFEGSIRGW